MKFKIALTLALFCNFAIAEDTVTAVIPLQHRTASEILPVLMPLLENTDRVVDNNGSLAIKTTPNRWAVLHQLITQLDTPLKNLLITVIQNSGKTAAELNANAGNANPDGNAIQMHGMNADTLEFSQQQNISHLRTTPGYPAYFNTVQLKQNQNAYAISNNGIYAGANTQSPEIGNGFAVTPQISGQEVIIDIEPWSGQNQSGDKIVNHGAGAQIRTRLGEWVEVAGNGSIQSQANSGFNTFNQQVSKNNSRILIKVETSD